MKTYRVENRATTEWWEGQACDDWHFPNNKK